MNRKVFRIFFRKPDNILTNPNGEHFFDIHIK
jgi:hypothetical protein